MHCGLEYAPGQVGSVSLRRRVCLLMLALARPCGLCGLLVLACVFATTDWIALAESDEAELARGSSFVALGSRSGNGYSSMVDWPICDMRRTNGDQRMPWCYRTSPVSLVVFGASFRLGALHGSRAVGSSYICGKLTAERCAEERRSGVPGLFSDVGRAGPPDDAMVVTHGAGGAPCPG